MPLFGLCVHVVVVAPLDVQSRRARAPYYGANRKRFQGSSPQSDRSDMHPSLIPASSIAGGLHPMRRRQRSLSLISCLLVRQRGSASLRLLSSPYSSLDLLSGSCISKTFSEVEAPLQKQQLLSG
jgi:hypothetical protein